MARILVTGANGFIGAHLIPRIRGLHHDISALGRCSGDVADPLTWRAFPDAEIVIHLAGKTFVPDSWKDPVGFFRTNLHGTLCALDYCRQRSARLIFISSYLYGTPKELPISERATVEANNPYALSKKMAEEVCAFYSGHYGLDVTVLRPFNIYGPGQDGKFLIPSIIEQALRGAEIRVKDLEPKRDYLYIEDLIGAFLCAIGKPQRFGVFNIASGTSYSVSEVIELVKGLTGRNIPVHSDNDRRPQEVMDTRADITKARDILAWQPRWSLAAGCAKMLEAADSLR